VAFGLTVVLEMTNEVTIGFGLQPSP
jgi:hypothetical protein